MTLKKWKKEFRKELDALRQPIERLDALLTLCPYPSSCYSMIREILAQLENEKKDRRLYRIDTDLLERLYQILTHLPKSSSHLDWLKKRYELSEIQQFALKDFLEFCSEWGNYYDVHKMDESVKDKVLEDIARHCEHWQELLESIQNDSDSQQLALLPTQPPEHINEEQTVDGLWYTCKPFYLLLNKHPWNRKAKDLLDQVYEYQEYDHARNENQQLYVISLMDFGIQSKLPELVEMRQRDWFIDNLEFMIYDLTTWSPIQVMHYITAPMDDPECTVNNLPELMEAETTVEGASALLWHLKEQMTYRGEI